ncbi:exported hypothetical protein [Nostocoides jenkinsii Ben 74]|uniref:Uncharacterized protein n=1 Tax=Nostocoides jenkinsii Ben 74 TaxID=1193518 RepID=A0A077MA67_9MICO|nr:exported hypothetical protein [Tetrasphaera jenkinsii Ben 74]
MKSPVTRRRRKARVSATLVCACSVGNPSRSLTHRTAPATASANSSRAARSGPSPRSPWITWSCGRGVSLGGVAAGLAFSGFRGLAALGGSGAGGAAANNGVVCRRARSPAARAAPAATDERRPGVVEAALAWSLDRRELSAVGVIEGLLPR